MLVLLDGVVFDSSVLGLVLLLFDVLGQILLVHVLGCSLLGLVVLGGVLIDDIPLGLVHLGLVLVLVSDLRTQNQLFGH